ncbi:MAG: NAD(P)-dependent oxidoreductase [Pseudomonadales bacterium]|nr:NAD(P)-dependent oxidoreductase [Pseudomonadales bacterium]
MGHLNNKTIFITGGSRGIGKQIALKAATDGANVVIAAKTTQPHPKLEGTIYSAAEEIEAAGGRALPVVVDVREEQQVEDAVNQAVDKFGGIDILINNASAIQLTGTEATAIKRFDLMHEINYRGTFLTSQKCIPHLRKAENPHVLNLAPPINLNPRWFGLHLPYTMAKYGMSFCVLGMAEEYKRDGIAFNALWPKTTIATAAIKNQMGGDQMANFSRTPQIMADAAYAIFAKSAKATTGNFFIDEDVLRDEGIEDFSDYRVNQDLEDSQLLPDLFL